MPLKAPPPELSTSRQAIQNAVKDVERTIPLADLHDFASATLEDVRRAALDLECQLAERQSLRNMRRLDSLFQGLQCYSEVMQVLCRGTHSLPWVWAPLSFILKVSSDSTEAFDRILRVYSHIAESLSGFLVPKESLQGKPQLYPVFAVFYTDILRFHLAAYRFLSRRCESELAFWWVPILGR